MNMVTTSPLGDFVRDAVRGQTIRVAVCGVENSGKTVLISALAAHLEDHDPKRDMDDGFRFDLGEGRTTDNFQLHTGRHGGENDPIGVFRYKAAKDGLSNDGWPAATQRPSELAFSFDVVHPNAKNVALMRLARNDRRSRRVTLRLLDVPGERIADFPMADKSFAEWSDDYFDSDAGGAQGFGAWLCEREQVDRDGGDAKESAGNLAEEELFERFAENLAKACASFNRNLTPSTVRLSPGGKVFPANPETFGRDAAKRIGLPGKPFVPLSKYWRERNRELARKFARNYDDYKREIVLPLTAWMKRAHCVLLLVDEFSALNFGEEPYRGAKQELEMALKTVLAPSGLGSALVAPFVRKGVSRSRVRIVATKADRANAETRKNLVPQIARMLGKAAVTLGIGSSENAILSCAAVHTHRKHPSTGDKKTVCELPSDMPDLAALKGSMNEKDGKTGQTLNPPAFHDPDAPSAPGRPRWIVRHSGLDAIARFILSLA